MSDKIGSLVVELAADMARFQNDMRQANRTAQDTMRRMGADIDRGVGMIDRSMSVMAGSIAGAFSVGSVIAFTQQTAQAALAAEKLNMQFKASTGSAQAAAREMEYIRKVSNDLGLNFQSTATAYSKFLASTRGTSIEGQQSQQVFEGVTEAVTALGLSTDEANGIFLALSQMMSKGKVSAEELTGQLNERLPGATKMAADALGVTTGELLKMMQEGKVLSADLLPKLAEQMHKTYGAAAEEAAQKGQAGINRFNNEVRETATIIGNKALPAINELANGMAKAMKQWREDNTGPLAWMFSDLTTGETYRKTFGDTPREITATGGADPQMSRIEADQRAQQEVINAQRKKEEERAAGAAAREKAAKEAQTEAQKRHNTALKEQADQMAAFEAAQKSYNDLLRDQNALLEEGLKGWDDLGFGQSLAPGNMLSWQPKGVQPFSLTGPGSSGFPDFEEATRAAEAYKKAVFDQSAIGGATNALLDYSAAVKDTGKQMYDSIGYALSDLETAMVDFAMTGKASFSDMANSIIADLTRIAYRQAIIGPLSEGLGNAIKGMFGSGESTSFGSSTTLGSGYTAPAAPKYSLLAGAKADGGPVTGGKTYLVGERGPELFTPGGSGTIIPNHQLGAQPPSVQVNIINQSGQPLNAEQTAPRIDGGKVIIDLIVKEFKGNPGFRAALNPSSYQ